MLATVEIIKSGRVNSNIFRFDKISRNVSYFLTSPLGIEYNDSVTVDENRIHMNFHWIFTGRDKHTVH